MLKKILQNCVYYLFKGTLSLRYRVTVKGLESIQKHDLDKGFLFLPNHPTLCIDPILVVLASFKKYHMRPLVLDYMYNLPGINTVLRLIDALPVPNFSSYSNSIKRKQSEKLLNEVVVSINNGENFLLYPAGKTKSSSLEVLGGTSAVHSILQEAQGTNVVLVRVKGLWGSMFSRALTGQVVQLKPTLWQGLVCALKNGIFFAPRRDVTIEFINAPADFPQKGSRQEINRYLENWYNLPDHMTEQSGERPGDSLMLVPHYFWTKEVPKVNAGNEDHTLPVAASDIPVDIKNKVTAKLAEMTERDPQEIKPEMMLSADLALDSLDSAELAIFLQDDFEIPTVPVNELTSVGKVMAIASKQVVCQEDPQEQEQKQATWNEKRPHDRLTFADGQTIPEVFFRNCDRMGRSVACGDARSGILTYPQVKMRALLLSEYVKTLPGKYVGILLPASVAATVVVLACQIAGKVPLMVNWTVGPRHLEAVVAISQVQAVLTSWAFIDRLENVNLDAIEDKLIMLEDVRNKFTLSDKIAAFYRSKLGADKLLHMLGLDKVSKDDQAVLLFTSGTESLPKGVPLSHHNILSDQRACLEVVPIYLDDVYFAILPPFHVFGFSIGGILCFLSGLKVAFSPDPTDGKRLAHDIAQWGVSILCGAPTFIKGILKAAEQDSLQTLRLAITGAEKAPPELFHLMEKIGKTDCLYEGYGTTECAPVITFNRFDRPQRGVGMPIPGVELLLVHPETHEPVAQGTQGHILVRGPNVFSGYLNPGLTPPFIEVGGKSWYKTGDIGILDEEGFLHIVGRIKRFIKVGAEMVSLASIEDALLQSSLKKGLPLEQEGASLAVCAKEQAGEKPKITLFSRMQIPLEDVNKMLREAGFSNLVRVTSVVTVDEIPMMRSGKINYRALETEHIA